ncbi:MAG: DUF1080 domain-containing protein [Planctomycetes bacterium]|nr:DUF1080 domain-containing protein [Planctomycetota bacterium]
MKSCRMDRTVSAGASLALAACLAAGAGYLAGCRPEGPKSETPPPSTGGRTGPEGKAPSAPSEQKPAAAAQVPGPPDADGWMSLFDGKTLAGWKSTDFGGQGQVEVKGGEIVSKMGAGDMTGVTWAGGDIPRIDYELSVMAKKTDGSDFFCGLTFPVKDSCASFIVGGWGGTLCGISCLDGYDASDNETTKMMTFEDNQWYNIRVQVTAAKIEAWIDDDKMVDVEIKERKVSVRWEVEPSQPLGLAAWRTSAAWKDLRVRKITAPE